MWMENTGSWLWEVPCTYTKMRQNYPGICKAKTTRLFAVPYSASRVRLFASDVAVRGALPVWLDADARLINNTCGVYLGRKDGKLKGHIEILYRLWVTIFNKFELPGKHTKVWVWLEYYD
jgi:hypothetical protein